MKKLLLFVFALFMTGYASAQTRSVPMTTDNFNTLFAPSLSETQDGIVMQTLGLRNGNHLILKDGFDAIEQDIYVKWYFTYSEGMTAPWGYFKLEQTSVGFFKWPGDGGIGEVFQNSWIYSRIRVNSDYSFEVVSSTGDYDDNGGAVVDTQSGIVPESERSMLANTTFSFRFWETKEETATITFGELIVPNHSPYDFCEIDNIGFEDQLIPAEIQYQGTASVETGGSGSDYFFYIEGNASVNDYVEFQVSSADMLSFNLKKSHEAIGQRIYVLVNGVNRYQVAPYLISGGSASFSPEWCEVVIPVVQDPTTVRIEFVDYDNQKISIDNIRQYVLNAQPAGLTLDNNTVDENSPAGTVVGAFSANDADSDPLTFSLTENAATDNDFFVVNGTNLETASVFDYETAGQYQIEVEVSDGISEPVTEMMTIDVNDVNEAPLVEAGQTLDFDEESPAGTSIGWVTATDEDATDNAPVFSIQSGNEDGYFNLDAATGELTLLQAGLNRYDYESFSLLIRATDEHDALLYTEETVAVNVGETPFSGGAGTEADPFQIKTPKDLDEIRNYLGSSHSDKYFALVNDIDLQEYLSEGNPGYNEGAFWDPVGGVYDTSFRGKLDGNGYTISNLRISRAGENYVGLFGNIYFSTISDLIIHISEGGSVEGNQLVGGLAGHAESSQINDVHVYGTIQGNSSYVGGICGRSYSSTFLNNTASVVVSSSGDNIGGLIGYSLSNFENCSVVGSISGTNNVGGMVGYNDNNPMIGLGSLTQCHANVSVNAVNGNAGGLAGYNLGTISDSYGRGSIIAPLNAGGVVGQNTYGEVDMGGFMETVTGTITNCYSATLVNGSDVSIGGFAGVNDGNITSSCWDINASGQENSAGGTGLNGIAMREAASFTDWDFTSIWGIDALEEYVSYPYLINNEETPHPGAIGKVTVTSWPAASDIVYGQTVGESVLSGGEATHEGSPVEGTFNFMFATDMNEVGTIEEEVAFFPTDEEAYLPAIDGSVSINVLPKTVSVVNAVAQDKVYDGTTVAVVSDAVLEDNAVEGDDDMVLSNHTSGTFAQAGAGDGITVTTNMTLSGTDAANYDLEQPDLTASISKASLTVTADDQARLYGEVNPELTFGYSGFVNGEDASVLTTLPSVSTLAEAGSNVGDYAITVSNGLDENYDFSYVDGVLSVNPAPLTVKAKDATRVEGEPNPEFELEFTGFVNGEDQGVIDFLPGVSCDADELSEPGDYPISVSGGDDGNYYFVYDNSGILTVTMATSTIKQKNFTTSVYPVPADDYVFIETKNFKVDDICLLNMAGILENCPVRKVSENLIRLDVRSLAGGIYFLRITGSEKVEIKKVVVR